MEYKRLGKSGLQLSIFSLGSWITFGNQINDTTSEDLMKTAYDNGINFFDNAELYADGESEVVMGKVLKKMGWRRDTFVISSKVFWGGKLPNQTGLSRKHVVEACHAALKRLQVDYLDLYYCHRPDRNTPIEETVFTMNDLIRQGKILYWGTSEWEAASIMEAYAVAKANHLIPPTMEQPQYNMFHRNRVELEYRRLYSEIGLGTTIWSPLASGYLTGKYNHGIPEGSRLAQEDLAKMRNFYHSDEGQDRIKKVIQLEQIAKDLNCSTAQLALAWCAKNEQVSSVILGATKVSQLEENLKALHCIEKLTPSVLEQIESILQNKPAMPIYG